jgi:hypothetical protein
VVRGRPPPVTSLVEVEIDDTLPGSELVRSGLADLAAGVSSEASLLLQMAAPRLQRLGFDLPDGDADAGHRLFELLSESEPSAHSRYLAGIRRMTSFASAAEHAASRR